MYLQLGPGNAYYLPDFIYDGFQGIEELIAYAVENKIKRESIPVVSENSLYETQYTGSLEVENAAGYEYFRYTEGSNLPEGIELNKWYRRAFSYTTTTMRHILKGTVVSFEAAEECSF